jgi:transcriptional regulator of aromatic amino acid metabolism
MATQPKKSLWELLWDYDPNGLLVVDTSMRVRLVNRAFCNMFNARQELLIGESAMDLLEDVADFHRAWNRNMVIQAKKQYFPQYNLYVRKVIFPIPDEGIIACIMVNLTHEWKQEEEMRHLRQQTIERVNEVVDNQMKVAQEIASLLGETTAETKVSLMQLLQVVQQEKR